MTVSVHAAKTHLSRLLDLVESGEEVIVERHGKPVAQLVPVKRKKASSAFGAMQGELTMADGWERPMNDDEAEAFLSGR